MIFSNKKYLVIENYDDKIKKAFQYLVDNDLETFEPGSYKIDGENVFVNIVHYNTKAREERFWEAHREYLDLHFVFSGNERIDLAFIDNLEFDKYVGKDDFVSMQGMMDQSIVLRKDDFLIIYPEDVHRTCVIDDKSELVKKAIFKIKIN